MKHINLLLNFFLYKFKWGVHLNFCIFSSHNKNELRAYCVPVSIIGSEDTHNEMKLNAVTSLPSWSLHFSGLIYKCTTCTVIFLYQNEICFPS